jgi:hypothetical protein
MACVAALGVDAFCPPELSNGEMAVSNKHLSTMLGRMAPAFCAADAHRRRRIAAN